MYQLVSINLTTTHVGLLAFDPGALKIDCPDLFFIMRPGSGESVMGRTDGKVALFGILLFGLLDVVVALETVRFTFPALLD